MRPPGWLSPSAKNIPCFSFFPRIGLFPIPAASPELSFTLTSDSAVSSVARTYFLEYSYCILPGGTFTRLISGGGFHGDSEVYESTITKGFMLTGFRICHEFSRAGKCKVQNCKLSHDVHNNTNTDNKNTTKVSKKLQVTGKESSFSAWKLHVPLKPSRTRPLGNQLGPFLQEARRLVDQDVGVLQEVICTLAGEAGLKRLQELIEGNHLATLSTFQKSAVFTNQMLPFLGFVTHPRVLASLILEEEVGTIYSFLYGPAGRRALVLLGFLADILLLNKGQVAEGTVTHLEMSVVVFWQIIKVNPTALVNDELKPVAGRFKAIVEHYEGSQSPHSLGSVKLYMDRVLHRLSIGDAIPSATHPKQTAPKEKLLPLSNIKQAPPGGRHNNDFADICDIRILPTTEEILSPHTEYLPVKDHQQWHLDGVPGLLDRNFRLLRQDTIGQLKSTIRALLRPSAKNKAKN